MTSIHIYHFYIFSVFSAEQTRKKFVDMSEIVSEILQGSLSTKAWNELENERLELEMDSKNRSRSRLEKNVAKIDAEIKETKKDVDKWTGRINFLGLSEMYVAALQVTLPLTHSLTRVTPEWSRHRDTIICIFSPNRPRIGLYLANLH